jgi:nitroreductase
MDCSPLQKLIQDRRSIRTYLDRPVEREKLLACIEAGRLAPSAQNVQPWRFIVIDDPKTKEEFSQAAFSGMYAPTRFAAQAPALIAIAAHKDLLANLVGRSIQGTSWYLVDIGIAGEHIVLQAQELGLCTCWIGWFNAKKATSFLGLPSSHRVNILISIGYSSGAPASAQKRKPLEEILWFNRFGGEKTAGSRQ